jgi:5-methylcytosine-specific restriction endonuclease McrA
MSSNTRPVVDVLGRKIQFSSNAVTRRALFKADPHCHWCGCLTIIPNVPRWERGELTDPPNLATVDHVISRRTRKSRLQYHSPKNKVLACFSCNVKRAMRENALLGKMTEKRKVPEFLPEEIIEHRYDTTLMTTASPETTRAK